MLSLTRSVLGALPFAVSLGGRKPAMITGALDPFFSAGGHRRIETGYGPILLDMRHKPERLLGYSFANVMRHYRASPLGQHILARSVLGGSFIDVGANLGLYSLIAGKAGLTTFLVEPEPAHVAFLAANPAAFGTVIPVALSDAEASMPLYYNPDNSGATSLVAAPGYRASSETVAVTRFTALSNAGTFGDPAKITLIKVDVEGFEAQMIRGMEGFLESGHRPDIWCEVRGDLAGRAQGSFREVTAVLARFGYAAFDGEAAAPRATPAVEARIANRQVFDLLFTTDS